MKTTGLKNQGLNKVVQTVMKNPGIPGKFLHNEIGQTCNLQGIIRHSIER
tara:strand:- start:204 stop:353 length:150 start_codon:yes stop_codon:yes gene_type:complete